MPGRATSIPELSQTYRKPGKFQKFFNFLSKILKLGQKRPISAKSGPTTPKTWRYFFEIQVSRFFGYQF